RTAIVPNGQQVTNAPTIIAKPKPAKRPARADHNDAVIEPAGLPEKRLLRPAQESGKPPGQFPGRTMIAESGPIA
ncbi:MAG TPA: hypothetical protein VN857_03375, partial [Chthoniobacterales bacterium]|nr:hypothetical protein [Chthoniobacterales bacterium]